MESFAAAIWDLLAAPGRTFALTFIVLIVVGINALTLLFFGSAVVALERFARAITSWRTVAVAWGVFSAVATLGVLGAAGEEWLGESGTDPGAILAAVAAGTALVTGLVMGGVWLLLRHVSGASLGLGGLALLGGGYGLLVGGGAQPTQAAVPIVFAAAVAAAGFWRRRRRGLVGVTGTEQMGRWLTVALLPGLVIASALEAPHPLPAGAGAALLTLFAGGVALGLLPLAAAGLVDSRKTVEWFIARRYLVAKRRQTFISVITGICVVGIAAGVWLIITVLSVMNGFERTWRDEIIGNRAHFTVHSGLGPFRDYEDVLATVEAHPDVTAAAPYLDAEGMVRGDGGQIVAVRVRGVDPARVGNVTDLRSDLVAGSIDSLDEAVGAADVDPGIVVGSQLAGSLGLGLDDELVLISPFGGPQTPLGPAPRLKRFRVVGIFETSFFQYDEMFTYVSLPAARDFRRVDDVVDGIEARTTDFYRSRKVAGAVQSELGFPYYTRDWKEFFPAFFQALKTERVMMFILLTMIMVVAAFSIVSTLVMMIMEKSSDIAILKAMGAEDASIERIFAIEGTLIGLAGTALGVVAGVAVTGQIAWIQRQIEDLTGIDTLPATVYQLSTLPAELDPVQIGVAVGLAMILSLGATVLPSRQGARIDPVEALRYE